MNESTNPGRAGREITKLSSPDGDQAPLLIAVKPDPQHLVVGAPAEALPARFRSTRTGWSDHCLLDNQTAPELSAKWSAAERAISPYVDIAYYSQTYPDIVGRDTDPVHHFDEFGWREGRNPSPTFDTNYYLAANPDVTVRGVNPLWHYVVAGRNEGRQPSDKAAYRVALLKSLATAEEKTRAFLVPSSLSILQPDTLNAVLAKGIAARAQFILSLSHDDYLAAVGGTQIFIADEQQKYLAAGAAYLHVSPIRTRLRLADPAEGTVYLRLILNGVRIGCTDAATLVASLTSLADARPARRRLVCHATMGHAVADILLLQRALDPVQSVFWLHDYSSLCEGLNLLRNDVGFCGAPPAESQACRICIYGGSRIRHVAAMRTLFESIGFDVVAPSAAAMAVFLAGSDLPVRSRQVLPHAVAELSNVRRSLVPIEQRGKPSCPIRVAFAGHPGRHKGWEAFTALLAEVGARAEFRFFHFSTEQVVQPGIEHIAVRVSPADRDAMRLALEEHAIDLVLVLSPWPETFSYVTHEAIVAGADVVAFADSGNVAAEVLHSGRGIVLDDIIALIDLFVSGRAISYVRLCYEQGNGVGQLLHVGTTAALKPRNARPDKAGRPA